MDVPIYAAYGSNMHPEQMLTRCPHSPMSGTGWLHGWRLTFAGATSAGKAHWRRSWKMPTQGVRGAVRRSRGRRTQPRPLEGAELGFHRKIRVRVDTADGPTLAWLYVVDGYEGGLPSARYLGVMADAAEIAGAPSDYVRDLRTRNSRNVGPGRPDVL